MFFFISLLLTVIIAVSSVYYVILSLQPLAKNSDEKIEVTIQPGTSTASIGKLLEEQKVIKSGTVFRYYAKYKSETGLQAGPYLLSPGMNVQEIIDILASGKTYVTIKHKLIIPEGSQLVEIAGKIAAEFKMEKEQVIQQLNDPAFLKQLQASYPTLITDKIFNPNIKYPLEGYLFPATYSFYKEENTIEDIIKPMLTKTDQLIKKNKLLMDEQKLDVHDTLTLASLIEEEATSTTDRQNISSVFYNRLAVNMPLQTDPTVLYAVGKHKERVLYSDLKVNSPYNTYIVKGLPVGPIANSAKVSVMAALQPAKTEYYYFLATSEGEVIYSKTLAEHNAAKAKYITQKK
ncbi:endolytic transglycosylase MltG [Bacillus sp. 165]|uniref:endolytic transglycosylase MltG n=1 Tax=Bacillus sp. 165 TaxID=1529117 RepID=UPI001FFE1836|nr:endolytic transglycosylase MltG [Bacillus sp. 165]